MERGELSARDNGLPPMEAYLQANSYNRSSLRDYLQEKIETGGIMDVADESDEAILAEQIRHVLWSPIDNSLPDDIQIGRERGVAQRAVRFANLARQFALESAPFAVPAGYESGKDTGIADLVREQHEHGQHGEYSTCPKHKLNWVTGILLNDFAEGISLGYTSQQFAVQAGRMAFATCRAAEEVDALYKEFNFVNDLAEEAGQPLDPGKTTPEDYGEGHIKRGLE